MPPLSIDAQGMCVKLLSVTTGALWHQLADRIAVEIRSGQRAPGSRLPSFADLAQDGLSQATVSRAYRHLASQGLAMAVHGAGTFVADPLPAATSTTAEVLDDHEQRIAHLEALVARLSSDKGSEAP